MPLIVIVLRCAALRCVAQQLSERSEISEQAKMGVFRVRYVVIKKVQCQTPYLQRPWWIFSHGSVYWIHCWQANWNVRSSEPANTDGSFRSAVPAAEEKPLPAWYNGRGILEGKSKTSSTKIALTEDHSRHLTTILNWVGHCKKLQNSGKLQSIKHRNNSCEE